LGAGLLLGEGGRVLVVEVCLTVSEHGDGVGVHMGYHVGLRFGWLVQGGKDFGTYYCVHELEGGLGQVAQQERPSSMAARDDWKERVPPYWTRELW
jgi:hypothetical protein